MWGLIKMLGAAAAVGAGAGAIAKGRIDNAIKGEPPKKVKRSKVQVIEIPNDVDVEEVNVLARKRKQQAEED